MQIEFKKIAADSKSHFTYNVKRAAVLTLLAFIIMVQVAPSIKITSAPKPPPTVMIDVDHIPPTRQIRRKPPPPKPTIPIPSDDETIPEDLTIEETTLDMTLYSDLPGAPDMGNVLVPPKPIAWVFPEYPEEEKKRGVQGIVKLSIHIDEKGKVIEVVIMDNSTGSKRCGQAAREAAFSSRFFPAKEANKAVEYWTTQEYQFRVRR